MTASEGYGSSEAEDEDFYVKDEELVRGPTSDH